MFNAQRYMSMNNAYFAPSTMRFPYEMKVFDRILHELQYLDREHPHHFALELDQLDIRVPIYSEYKLLLSQYRTRIYV